MSLDSFNTQASLTINGIPYQYFSLSKAEHTGLTGISRLPYSLKILLENLLRHEDNKTVFREDMQALVTWLKTKTSNREIAFRPARVLMQDFTGVPAIVDLAAMRDAIQKMGGNPDEINPLTPVDLVIDHSVQVDFSGNKNALEKNAALEMARNKERYEFLRWGQKAFHNFRVVPPDTGICHQVNLEFLAKTVWTEEIQGQRVAYPDTLVGTDSHTTMINGLGVLGWGVGGIEAEAAMLGQPISMLIPEVVGVQLTGKLREGVTATDLVLTLTQLLRKKGVVGKFVEYFGPGLQELPLADRATIANMVPEYGATCGFFPIDKITIDYLRLTGRDTQTIALAEAYAKAQGIWYDSSQQAPIFTDILALDLATVEPSMAGPKRPQDRLTLAQLKTALDAVLKDNGHVSEPHSSLSSQKTLQHGDVVIAAITSCTNTSNPSVLMAAGLVAKKAAAKGLKAKPWVKTSLAPGSQVVTRYLEATGLQKYLDAIGFSLVGYGCTTCIGNSGPLADAIATTITQQDLIVSAVLSGNRNFEGRIHPLVKANWLASPPLVVAFALAGTTRIDLQSDPLGHDTQGQPVYLKDIWPSNAEIAEEVKKITSHMFNEQYSQVFHGNPAWTQLSILEGKTYTWRKESTYIQNPPYFIDMLPTPPRLQNIQNARILALLGDSVTTDHISPAGSIKLDSPAGRYLQANGVATQDFNSLGARRGNHEVMMRGTFANIRIKNEIVPGTEGGITRHFPSNETLSIYEAAMRYQQEGIPLIVIAGKEYGTGSSRDWAAKGPKLLGVHAVIAESFERIHRSNLIGMGILPLQFPDGMTRKSLELTGIEAIDLLDVATATQPRTTIKAIIHYADKTQKAVSLLSRIDTLNEVEYYRHGGILQYVLRNKVDS
ncbi:MAG: aconitate hydratase 1 [Gammaproteobacteria bacterium RIFCSPHIGHO2_12_FULL_41_20]|nr:MAG: aconitate hydratase 1 [Gammaproteobacteria bacterium RIFCSPHIGHO2_12_FULL_41_20]